jgi:hypothetical protein
MKMFSAVALGLFLVACSSTGSLGDRPAISDAVYKQAGIARSAWELKDARMLVGNQSEAFVVKTTDGKSMSGSDLVSDVQRRMDETKQVKGLSVHIDSIAISGPTATVVSTQKLTRVVNQNGVDRTQISTVQQRQQFKKSATGEWVPDTTIEQLTANAEWAAGPKA